MTNGQPPRVGIVSDKKAPNLTEDGQALQTELRSRELSAEPVLWTDSQVDWETFDALLIRSCWEYYTRPGDFIDWLDRVQNAGVPLLNPADAIKWNLHKFYLRDLAKEGISILPTVWIERPTAPDLQRVLRNNDWQEAVVKPAIGTSSAGVWRTSLAEAPDHQQRFEALVASTDVLVQQFAPEISDGERSLVFFEGSFSHATIQMPAPDEFRAHPEYGGTTEPFEPRQGIIDQARDVLETAAKELGISSTELTYARVDGIRCRGDFLLMELELIEPYLSLDAGDDAVTAFADAIESGLRRQTTARTDPKHSP